MQDLGEYEALGRSPSSLKGRLKRCLKSICIKKQVGAQHSAGKPWHRPKFPPECYALTGHSRPPNISLGLRIK
ncbi:MAG: hypothetical protein HC899_09725 [Leptolyngbyaceae cyanobacterium SM1_4_3]|nr:hypothetical protein [Leptolyngbyaceae cyanobacterium SM1_4_3]